MRASYCWVIWVKVAVRSWRRKKPCALGGLIASGTCRRVVTPPRGPGSSIILNWVWRFSRQAIPVLLAAFPHAAHRCYRAFKHHRLIISITELSSESEKIRASQSSGSDARKDSLEGSRHLLVRARRASDSMFYVTPHARIDRRRSSCRLSQLAPRFTHRAQPRGELSASRFEHE